jgi:hypothetical protein
VVRVLVIVMLSWACTPPPVQRPLEGAPPVAERGASGDPVARASTDASVPPTLSASSPTPVGSPGQGPSGGPSPVASPSPEPGYVIVATDGRGANLREQPGTSSRVITTLAEGTAVDLFPDQAAVAGQTWRKIRSAGREGWVVSPVVRKR